MTVKKSVKKTVKKTVKKKKTGSKTDKLTGNELDFCHAYIAKRFNGTKACRAARYKGSDNTLGVTAYELLRKPKIIKKISELTNEYLADKKRLGRDVIGRLADLGFRKISDIVEMDDKGRTHIKSFDEMGESVSAINKIEVKQVDFAKEGKIDDDTPVISSEVKVWLEGTTKPLEILGKHTGQVVEKSEQSINFPNGEFANTREIDLSKVPTDKLKKIQADLKAMEEVIPELREKR